MSDFKFKYGEFSPGSRHEIIDGIPASYTSKLLSDEDSENLVKRLLSLNKATHYLDTFKNENISN